MEHWFGLPVPAGVTPVRSWGARAILRLDRHKLKVRTRGRFVGHNYQFKTVIEMVPDRSQYRGPDILADEAVAFFVWLEKTAIPRLRTEADALGLAPDDDQELAIDDGPYHLRANPRRSYGYLYIVAWEASDGEATT